MIKPNYDQGLDDPNTKWAIRFFFLFFFIGFGYICYKAYVEYTSEVRYTVLHFYESYSDGKGNGMKVSYMAEGVFCYANCFTTECRKIKKGERRLGYYFIDDPSFYGIFYEIEISDSVQVPTYGWKEIPEFLQLK